MGRRRKAERETVTLPGTAGTDEQLLVVSPKAAGHAKKAQKATRKAEEAERRIAEAERRAAENAVEDGKDGKDGKGGRLGEAPHGQCRPRYSGVPKASPERRGTPQAGNPEPPAQDEDHLSVWIPGPAAQSRTDGAAGLGRQPP